VPTVVSRLSSSPVNHVCLECLRLNNCDSLSGVLHLPPSLKEIFICSCSSIQVLSCQLDGLPKPQEPSEGEHSLPPCLEELNIHAGMLGGILCLPTSLKQLIIRDVGWGADISRACVGPTPVIGTPLAYSLQCPGIPTERATSIRVSLESWSLEIKDCPAIKKLPRCLQQRLGSIDDK